MSAPLGLIVAAARNGVIGRNGTLPWRIPEDLRHFRRVTTGHAIIMGRRTHDSIGRALPERRNIVVTRDATWHAEGCERAASVESAIAMARETDSMPIVIGGAAIYAAALPRVTRVWLTRIERDVEGDVLFPALNASEWVERERRQVDDVVWLTLDRAA